MTRFVTVLAMLALPFPALAEAQSPCIAAKDAQGMLAFIMPDLIDATANNCKAALPSDAFLVRSGKDLAGRYRVVSEASWPAAKRALIVLAGKDGDIFKTLPDEASKALFGATISFELSKSIKPASCPFVSDILEQLAPLPPQNTANLIGLIMEAAGQSNKIANRDFRVCPRTLEVTAQK